MSNKIEQACPLCGQPARYKILHEPYCKHFTCLICVEFCIDELSERHLKTVPAAFRFELSAKAKITGEKHMLVMRKPTVSENKAQVKPPSMMIAETVNLAN